MCNELPDKSIRTIANKLKQFPVFSLFDVDHGVMEIELIMKFGSFMSNSNNLTTVPHAIMCQLLEFVMKMAV